MNYLFRLDGEVPSKKNSRINLQNRKSIPSKAYQEWHSTTIASLFCQAVRQKIKTPISGPVTICVEFCHKNLHRKDSDNGLSSILDALVDAAILKDDNWQIVTNIIVENSLSVLGVASCKITVMEL
ncbi:RusA family crossover junction endodeoxyribonuclease [Treponema sp.]|uniref:RusA family crossover junction endodeoxyribonuclease n=1 Tax=Treponema sp. TaxID=166 RepID=UPI0025E39A44|nr:RusA family crossover junction endodeoxyribonuclease [Treponema sp.]MCR5218593.1 RusA family crossover junction endodeoxyribonuclease [Treponema sp.]